MLSVSATPPSRYEEVLSFLLGNLSEQEKRFQIRELLESAKNRQLDFSGLLMATRGFALCGAALSMIQPDDSAFVWAPVVEDSPGNEEIEDELLQFMGGQLDDRNVWMGQCIVDREATPERKALERNQFKHVADLVYMQCLITGDLPGSELDHPLELLPYTAKSNHERFRKVLGQTYINTHDCAVLNDLRSLEETLESHQLSGDFLPDQWNLFQDENGDIGLLLMNDHPDQNAWEVVYVGVVPEARGKGYGREIILAGLNRAKEEGRGQVILAVDAKNPYARRVYESLGFIETTRKSVHIRLKSDKGIQTINNL